MAAINGLSGAVLATPITSGGSGSQAAGVASPSTPLPSIIDGTPVRVVVLSLSAAVGLWALHAAGFRFNVGVSA